MLTSVLKMKDNFYLIIKKKKKCRIRYVYAVEDIYIHIHKYQE